MQGMTWAGMKKHPHLIGLFAITGVAVVGSVGYLLRCALKDPEIAWSRKENGVPWESSLNKQYVFYSPTRSKSDFVSQAPNFREGNEK